jgi:hypothetical protein
MTNAGFPAADATGQREYCRFGKRNLDGMSWLAPLVNNRLGNRDSLTVRGVNSVIVGAGNRPLIRGLGPLAAGVGMLACAALIFARWPESSSDSGWLVDNLAELDDPSRRRVPSSCIDSSRCLTQTRNLRSHRYSQHHASPAGVSFDLSPW